MDLRTCHCGNQFENTRTKGGPRKGGPHQIYCSPRCNAIAVKCRAYGLDPHDYWKMLEEQDHRCAICKKHEDEEESGRQLALDHDHETGKVRGLLCISCNRYRVGKNTLQTAKAIVEYLRRPLPSTKTST